MPALCLGMPHGVRSGDPTYVTGASTERLPRGLGGTGTERSAHSRQREGNTPTSRRGAGSRSPPALSVRPGPGRLRGVLCCECVTVISGQQATRSGARRHGTCVPVGGDGTGKRLRRLPMAPERERIPADRGALVGKPPVAPVGKYTADTAVPPIALPIPTIIGWGTRKYSPSRERLGHTRGTTHRGVRVGARSSLPTAVTDLTAALEETGAAIGGVPRTGAWESSSVFSRRRAGRHGRGQGKGYRHLGWASEPVPFSPVCGLT